MLDLFSVEQTSKDAPKVPDDVCKFEGCNNESEGTIRFTTGRHHGEERVCKSCFERFKKEKPVCHFYSGGTRMFIQKLSWNKEN